MLSLFQGLVGISRYLGVCFCWEKYQPMMQPMNICVSVSIGCNDWLVFVLTNDVGNCFGDSRDLFFQVAKPVANSGPTVPCDTLHSQSANMI